MSRSYPTLYKLLSSAWLLKKVSVKNNTESIINKLNKRVPSMEPWGIPPCTFFAELKLLFICTDCLRFFESRHQNYTSDLMR